MNKNKLYSALMAGTMMMGTTLPVFAATTESQDVTQTEADSGTTRATEVLYTQASSYTVTIPKTITLDGATKAADYGVKVSGDISSDKKVSVVPQDVLADETGVNFYMVDQATTATKKADVVATVTQNATEWTSAELCVKDADETVVGTEKSGNVSAPDITAGSWKGTFTFNITLQDA